MSRAQKPDRLIPVMRAIVDDAPNLREVVDDALLANQRDMDEAQLDLQILDMLKALYLDVSPE